MASERLGSQTGRDRIYTMRQLNQHTSDVLREINEHGPALITRHGRFIALIVPLANRDVESALIGKILDDVEYRDQLLGDRTLERTHSTEDVADSLNLNLPSYSEREVYRDPIDRGTGTDSNPEFRP